MNQITDKERIRRNYCRHYIAHMLLYRFSMKDLTKFAKEQGLKKEWKNRHVDEFVFFEDKIYEAMNERLKNITVKMEKRLYEPYGTVEISDDDVRYHNEEFEKLLYQIVK